MQNPDKGKTIKLEGKVTLKSPLSHIGDSIGIDSYLATDTVIDENGNRQETFTFSGNAFRGLMRDMGAVYFLEKLGNIQIPLQHFYLLFSGGALSGEQSIDVSQCREYRKFIPHLALFGGGVGNQILCGKINVGALYPLCTECKNLLPKIYKDKDLPSWRQLTYEKSFTRYDDAKNDNHRGYIATEPEVIEALPENIEQPQPAEQVEQFDMFEAEHSENMKDIKENIKGPGKKKKETEAKKEKKDAPQQMRYTVELLAAGTQLYQRIVLHNVSDIELGAFVACLCKFSERPYIGGKQAVGCGLVDIEYNWQVMGNAEKLTIQDTGKFLSVSDEQIWMSKPAHEAKDKYDSFLVDTYIKYLEQNKDHIVKMLGVAA